MPPTASIQVSVMINRRVPMAPHALIEALVRVGPKHVVASRFDLERRVLVLAFQTAAYLSDEQVAFNHRSAAHAEEILHDMEFSAGVDLPHDLTIGRPNTVKHSLGAVDIDALAVDDRATAWAVVIAVVVLIIRRVFK